MWTFASLEADSEGLVEHPAFPFPLPPSLPIESLFQCCSLVEKERKRWQECPGDAEDAALSVDTVGPCALRS